MGLFWLTVPDYSKHYREIKTIGTPPWYLSQLQAKVERKWIQTLSTLRQSRAQGQGLMPVIVGWIFPHQIRQCLTDMPTSQADLESIILRLPLPLRFKLTVKTNHMCLLTWVKDPRSHLEAVLWPSHSCYGICALAITCIKSESWYNLHFTSSILPPSPPPPPPPSPATITIITSPAIFSFPNNV